MDGFVVDGMGRSLTQQLAMRVLRRERAVFPVEPDITCANLRHRPGVELVAVLFFKGRAVRIGHVVDQIDFAGPERGQANAVFFFRTADEAIEIGQCVALIVCFVPVLEALHDGGVELLPGLELERTAADRMRVCLINATRRHELDRIVGQVRHQNRTRVVQMKAHRPFIDDINLVNVFDRRTHERMANLGIEDAL